jgi:hypothetical protein
MARRLPLALILGARQWAADHGYTITGKPTPQAGGWGSSGVYGPPGQPPALSRQLSLTTA